MGRAQGYALLASIAENKEDQQRILERQYHRLIAALENSPPLLSEATLDTKRPAEGQPDEPHTPKKRKV